MTTTLQRIEVENAPAIDGLIFRHFRGEPDYPLMLDAIHRSAAADGVDRADTMEQIRNVYEHLVNSDPEQDVIMVEIDGELVGYGRALWWLEASGTYRYASIAMLVPEARRRGIGRALLAWFEARHRFYAAQHPADSPKDHIIFGNTSSVGLNALAKEAGYEPIRYGYEMVRPTLDDIEQFPMPDGVEIRPVTPDHYRAIWEADIEAFRDHWGFAEPLEEHYQQWLVDPLVFQPHLWQVAWDVETNEVAGQVRTFINEAENEKFDRKRGYTEFISVRRPWRRQGLARALIARSLQAQKEAGMTESALGVDSENLSGATRIYEACGFRVVRTDVTYGKPVELAG